MSKRSIALIGLFAVALATAWLAVRRPAAVTPQLQRLLLERLEGATLWWADEEPHAVGVSLVAAETGPLVRLDLQPGQGWRRLSGRGLGNVRNSDLVSWVLPLELPTENPGAVRAELSGELLPVWERPKAPRPFAAFYAAQGFLTNGLHLALPDDVDPSTLRLAALFPPERKLLYDLLGADGEAVEPAELVGWVRVESQHRRALFVPSRAAIEIPAPIPADAELVFGVMRRVYPWADRPEPTSLAIELDAGAGWQEVERITLDASPDGAEKTWIRARVDLREWEGRKVTLRFRVPESAEVGRVAHYVADPALVSVASPRRRPNLVLVTVDGLRADLQPWEGGGKSLTPNLARLAARGLTFTQARSTAPWTRPSVASMFTGLSPFSHGVDSERVSASLPAGVPTIAATLRSHGYATDALSANPHLHPAYGLPAGFANAMVEMQDGDELTRHLLRLLEERPFDPFFIFTFYMDTHAPWVDRPQYRDADRIEAPVRDVRRLGAASGRQERGETEPTEEEVAKLRALYEENVRYVDAQIGALLAGLERMHLERETIVVVTADHGEAFGEHGDFFHGWNVYDELSHVPLIAAGPGIPRGRRVETPISLAVLPDLLMHWAGITDVAVGMGADVEELLRDGQGGEMVLMTTRFRGTSADALLRWPWKLILTPAGAELYRLDEDPGELHDRAAAERQRALRLRQWLERRILADKARRAKPTAPDIGGRPDETHLEQLRALGYVGD